MYRVKILRILFLVLFLSLCFFSGFSIAGTVPQLINYQGTLTDTSGNPVPDGQYGVVFKIYDVATGGTALWTETWNNTTTPVITIKGGFSVLLGSNTPIPASFFSDHSLTYLGIKVGNDSEMLPRQRIASVAYALTSGSGGIPSGGIIMWSGAINQIPAGWALCDGNNGTPNLRDRFIVGAGGTYEVSTIGGSITKNLSHVHQMQDHAHPMTSHTHAYSGTTGGPTSTKSVTKTSSDSIVPDSVHAHTFSGSTNGGQGLGNTGAITGGAGNTGSGGSSTQDILPPYFALAFIMKL